MSAPPTAVSPRAPQRLEHIDGVRALAALVVYLNHAYAQVTFGDTVPLHGLLGLTRFSMVAGHLAVTVFIVVSGFCLTLPVIKENGALRGGVKEFFRRRARRILPPYYAALALCLLLIWTIIGKPTGSLWDFPLHVNTEAIVSHLLLLQDLFATSRINYVFWSIAVEWHIYFAFPVLVWAARRYGLFKVVPTALLLGYALRIAFGSTRLARANPHYLGMFTLGMLAAYLARSTNPRFAAIRERVSWSLCSLIAFAITTGVACVWGVRLSDSRFFILDLPVGIMAASLLVASSGPTPSALTRVLSSGALDGIGVFSFSFYLIHAPLLQVLWQYVLVPLRLSPEAMLLALMSGGLGLVLVASYAFFRAFEAPFMGGPRPQAIAPSVSAANLKL